MDVKYIYIYHFSLILTLRVRILIIKIPYLTKLINHVTMLTYILKKMRQVLFFECNESKLINKAYIALMNVQPSCNVITL